jgi:predicted CXXCH cytochrome family protein
MSRSRKTALLALLLASLVASPAYAETKPSVRIYVPESLTSVSSEGLRPPGQRTGSGLSTTGRKVALVGSIAGEKNPAIEIVNNDRSKVVPVFREGYFHAQVILSLGVNMIEVRWKKSDGTWDSESISIFRASKLEGSLTSDYPPYTFHKGENEERCQECHQMRLTKAELETGMEKSCLKCHMALTGSLYVHGPVNVGICTVCHDPESKPNKYQVLGGDDVLCYGCHEDRKKIDHAKKLMHGPVGAGLCTVCHDSHSSPFQYQLIKSRNEICLLCHQDDAERWMHENSVHPPFKNGDCAGCHDPHSSDYKYNLRKSPEELCSLCHHLPIPGHLHEVGKTPRFEVPPDFPLTAEGKTMCLTCHDPHGAVGPKLTRRDGCDGCHPK